MKELICIVCPKGCRLKVDRDNNVTGNACPRGEKYALAEITNPTRMLTTTVRIYNAIHPRLPVKTSSPIPKGKMFEVMELIDGIRVAAPVAIGDVIVHDVLGTGVDIIACADM